MYTLTIDYPAVIARRVQQRIDYLLRSSVGRLGTLTGSDQWPETVEVVRKPQIRLPVSFHRTTQTSPTHVARRVCIYSLPSCFCILLYSNAGTAVARQEQSGRLSSCIHLRFV